MVSNQVLQKTIEELKAITKVNLAALSLDGTVAAATSEDVREDWRWNLPAPRRTAR